MRQTFRQHPFRPVQWIDTGGGPFVIIPAQAYSEWEGVRGEAPTDFDRACEVSDYLGVIPFSGASALVLGDAPFPTAFVSGPSFGGGYIVRMLWGDDLEEAARVARQLHHDDWGDEAVTFSGDASGLVLIDAADAGRVSRQMLHLPLGAGDYSVSSADWEDDSMCLLLHRLVPLS